MEIHQLRYFVAAAESRGMTAAARRCRVSQPSLSQQIRKLERQLGVELFDRLARGVTLTAAGAALLPRAKKILAEVESVRDGLNEDIAAGAGSLHLGAIPTMAPQLLPPALTGVRHEFPRCEVTLREDLTERLVEAIDDTTLDIALVSTPIEHDRIRVETLGNEPMLVALPAEHELTEAETVSLTDLRDQETITLHEMHCLGKQVSAFCAAKRLARRVVCRTTQLSTVLELVRTGAGVSLIPRMAALPIPGVVYAPLRSPAATPRRDIAMITHADRARPPQADTIAHLISEQLHQAE